MMRKFFSTTLVLLGCSANVHAADNDVERLVAAVLGDTPVVRDLQELTDGIGQRVTGSDANRRAVEWALERFRQAEVSARAESFTMPYQWQEKVVTASIRGADNFFPGVAARPFSAPAAGLSAPLVDAGSGTEADFERLGDVARGAWALVDVPVLDDDIGLAGLFGLYGDAMTAENNAAAAGVAGVVYASPYPKNLVYRQFASGGYRNELPLLVMEREDAQRAQRLIRAGRSLEFKATIEIEAGGTYESANVVAEIRGSRRPSEVVLFGAHLDSHDMGTGALDNGVNCAMLIDIARQFVRLGLEPERTIRFVLWNGEEQGLVGSWKYTEQHEDELDNHIVAASFDIGSGRTTGFFTGGRPALVELVDRYLEPVAGLGPFQNVDVPIVGTDNFDFMVEGVPNLVALQSDANYASNYHAESDTFDKVDQYQLKLNAAIAAAVIWGFANDTARLPRHDHAQVRKMIETFDLEPQMRSFAVWQDWADGIRGRHE